MLIEATECDRARRFGSRTLCPPSMSNGGLTFEPIDRATRMSWSLEAPATGPGSRAQLAGSGPAGDATEP
jgi:hypothetical protein